MVWLAVTRSPIPVLMASAAMTSRKRDSGSSVSSQWTSMGLSYFSASLKVSFTDAAPISRVCSKCGMPPTASAPSLSASSMSSAPLG